MSSAAVHAVRVIKPENAAEAEEATAEVVDEDELPEYVADQLMNATPFDENEDVAKMDPVRRTTKIIVDLVNAGSLFEEKLAAYRDYLDEALLEKFYRRIEMAENYEDPEAAEGLRIIWRRVRAEVERKNASPALRLLDKLLVQMHPSSGGSPKERYRSALGLMYEAFTSSQSETVDIFGLAESLARGEAPPSDLMQEFVRKDDFVAELQEILDDADGMDQDLSAKKDALLQRRTETELDEKELKMLSSQLTALERFVEEREQSLRDVAKLLEMASAI